MEEKIEKKRQIISYLNATIEQYTRIIEESKSYRKKEIKQSALRLSLIHISEPTRRP